MTSNSSLGVSWVWMGIEGENSQYAKVQGVDTFALVRQLQSHGIRVLGSTIIGLEDHTPDNIDQVIDYAVRHNTDFHQFMLYMPLPGTPLHAEFCSQGRMVDETECPLADTHGQSRFNYRHAHIAAGLESELIVRAFERDFAANGPSMMRMLGTVLAGWKRYKNHPDSRIRRRFAWEVEGMATTWSAVVAAVRRYYRRNPARYAKMSRLLEDMNREFGWSSRLSAALGGPYVLWKIRQEERRLAAGWTYEPPTFYEVNDAVPPEDRPAAVRCRYVTPQVVSPEGGLEAIPLRDSRSGQKTPRKLVRQGNLEPLTKPKSETFGRRFRRGQRTAPNGFVSGSKFSRCARAVAGRAAPRQCRGRECGATKARPCPEQRAALGRILR